MDRPCELKDKFEHWIEFYYFSEYQESEKQTPWTNAGIMCACENNVKIRIYIYLTGEKFSTSVHDSPSCDEVGLDTVE